LEEARLLWQSAADLIRLDMEATTDLRWPLLVEVRSSWSGEVQLGFNYGSSDTGLSWLPTEQWLADAVATGEIPAAATVLGLASAHLADMANENVMEALERPWPECNVHHRPMDPTPDGPTGTWQCSKDPRHFSAVGGLATLVDAGGLLIFV
jgi:hypothetical protein